MSLSSSLVNTVRSMYGAPVAVPQEKIPATPRKEGFITRTTEAYLNPLRFGNTKALQTTSWPYKIIHTLVDVASIITGVSILAGISDGLKGYSSEEERKIEAERNAKLWAPLLPIQLSAFAFLSAPWAFKMLHQQVQQKGLLPFLGSLFKPPAAKQSVNALA
jgi:hypothetical protein